MTDDDQKSKGPSKKRQVLKQVTARESLAWLILVATLWGVGGYVNWLEYELRSIRISPVIVIINEATSGISALFLVLFVRAWLDQFPLSLKAAAKSLPAHLLGSALFSFGHVSLMIGLRYIAFAALDQAYRPAIPDGSYGVLKMFAYEYGKDFPVYWVFLMIIFLYRLYQDHKRQRLEPKGSLDKIKVRSGNADVLLDLDLVDCFQAASNYVRVFVSGKEYLIRCSLAELETTLDKSRFIRVHRSFIVNLGKAQKIVSTDGGNRCFEMHDGRKVPIGRKYRNALDQVDNVWTGAD
ncbi:LytTR family DNA-binding domain-containing protein [Kordiimonas lacus]|uniref:LytTr DNA-binding domain-containing protein n=1 Tax=Kordiimonas lacus TaxID=637679 RepID=A0A1G7F4Y0_9PROT|nr:LytTR family DNA-binding domain-containing protein [Kordiimonas lacus]SDE71003.1 LytTr DNA-binding domain-containing protein [Kordiimonas lacus]